MSGLGLSGASGFKIALDGLSGGYIYPAKGQFGGPRSQSRSTLQLTGGGRFSLVLTI